MSSASLEKQIATRIRKNKCTQKNCNSQNSQFLEIVVFGEQKYKRKGLMCSTCFIDNQLLGQLGNIQAHSISIQKFMKVLTQQYNTYAQKKVKQDWAPNVFEQRRNILKKKIIKLEKNTQKGVMEIMKFIEDAKKKAQLEAQNVNKDENFDKIHTLLNEQQDQRQRININKQIKQVVSKIEVEQGQFKLSTQDELKKQNEKIIVEYRKKVEKAKATILKLLEVHQRCLKFLIQ